MSITSISNNSQYLSPLQLLNQPKQDLTSLGNALNSGDLAGAQTAFSAFQQDLQKIQAGTQSGTTPAKDFQTLQDALSSGDLAGAKKAFDTFMQDVQHTKRRHHYHHHRNDGSTTAGSASTGTDTSSDGANGTGSNINVTA